MSTAAAQTAQIAEATQAAAFTTRGADGAPLHATVHTVAGTPVSGADALVVLAHGLGLSTSSWDQTVSLLLAQQPGLAVLTYDHRGHGVNTDAAQDAVLDLDLLADDLGAVITAARYDHSLTSTPTLLAGHSLGGMVAATALATGRTLENLSGLALISSSSGCLTGGGLLRCLPSLARRHPNAYSTAQNLVRSALSPVIGARAEHDGPQLNPINAAQLLGSLGSYDVTAALKQAIRTIPTALLVGSADRITPPAHSKTIASMCTSARLTVLDDQGHDLPASAPGDIAGATAGLLAAI